MLQRKNALQRVKVKCSFDSFQVYLSLDLLPHQSLNKRGLFFGNVEILYSGIIKIPSFILNFSKVGRKYAKIEKIVCMTFKGTTTSLWILLHLPFLTGGLLWMSLTKKALKTWCYHLVQYRTRKQCIIHLLSVTHKVEKRIKSQKNEIFFQILKIYF